MGYSNIIDEPLNIINYLAIISLEKLGNFEPTEDEITAMESFLTISINKIVYNYARKFKKNKEKIQVNIL